MTSWLLQSAGVYTQFFRMFSPPRDLARPLELALAHRVRRCRGRNRGDLSNELRFCTSIRRTRICRARSDPDSPSQSLKKPRRRSFPVPSLWHASPPKLSITLPIWSLFLFAHKVHTLPYEEQLLRKVQTPCISHYMLLTQ